MHRKHENYLENAEKFDLFLDFKTFPEPDNNLKLLQNLTNSLKIAETLQFQKFLVRYFISFLKNTKKLSTVSIFLTQTNHLSIKIHFFIFYSF